MLRINNNFFIAWELLGVLLIISPNANASQSLIAYQPPLSLAILLHIATKNNNTTYATELIALGADIDHQDPQYNNTSLWYALRNKNYGIARLLINAGANAQARCCFQHPNGYMVHEPLLFYAVRQDNPENIRLCIHAGASVNTDNMGQSALAIAARNNHVRAIETLVKAGIDITQKDQRGFSALQLALRSNAREAVEKLLELGAGAEELEHLQAETMRTLMAFERYQLIVFCVERGALIDHQEFWIKKAPSEANQAIRETHRNAKKTVKGWLKNTEDHYNVPRSLTRLIGSFIGLSRTDNLPPHSSAVKR